MVVPDPTYQTKIYTDKGGDRLVGKTSGEMNCQSGFNFFMASQVIAAEDIARVIHSQMDPALIIPLALNSVMDVSNLPANQKFVKIIGSATMVSASFWLTSCSAGAEVHLHLCGDSVGAFDNASTQIDVSTSGCIILDSVGAAVSGFEMHTSIASDCGVHLVAFADNVWSIVSQFGDINT